MRVRVWTMAGGVGILAAGLLLALPAGSQRAATLPEHAPPAHTGGFGEPTCHACHFDGEVNAGGALSVSGFPERYVPGREYRVLVTLRGQEMRAAGFQLAVRFAEGAQAGRQAGTLRSADARTAVVAHTNAVQYAGHTRVGTRPDSAGTARWAVLWTAPAGAPGSIAVHAAANAADGDASALGDQIVTTHRRIHETPGIGQPIP